MKVEPTVRCTACSRPLFMPAPVRTGLAGGGGIGTIISSTNSLHTTSDDGVLKNVNDKNISDSKLGNTGKDDLKIGKIWGNIAGDPSLSGLVVYSNKLAYHRSCYEFTLK